MVTTGRNGRTGTTGRPRLRCTLIIRLRPYRESSSRLTIRRGRTRFLADFPGRRLLALEAGPIPAVRTRYGRCRLRRKLTAQVSPGRHRSRRTLKGARVVSGGMKA